MAAPIARLSKLEASGAELTAKQRVILAARSLHKEGRFNPSLKQGMTEIQHREFAQLVDLVFCAESQIGPMVFVLEEQAVALSSENDRLSFMFAPWDEVRSEVTRALNTQPGEHWKKVVAGLEAGRRDARMGIRTDAKGLLGGALAIELVWAEISEQFDGNDVVRPNIKDALAHGRLVLERLLDDLSFRGRRTLKPDEAILEGLRTLIKTAYDIRSFGRQRP